MLAHLLARTSDAMSRVLPRRSDVAFASSSGGHLELLKEVSKPASGISALWVTIDDARAESLRVEGRTVHTLPRFDKQNLNVKNPLRSPLLAWRLRPRVVVTSGAGVVIVFCVCARLLGSRLLFVETMARVSSPSHTGRVLARIADQVFVQWPDLLLAYPKATLCRPLLLEGIQTERAEGVGTFVSLGTHDAPFDRLLAMVDDAVEAGVLPRPLLAQSGSSVYGARNFHLTPWLSRDEFSDAISNSRYVIGHAGAALASAALKNGRKPLLLPRRKRFGEHVDDHQIELANKLAELGLALSLGDRISKSDLRIADESLPPATALSTGVNLGDAINRAIQRP
jgi:UDP-N-acetylglucosamine--N-acetylmuramyl-(pentapeptide) pyrophosphoryl-undecaprenol N-acetylglucosamine transferase